MLNFVMMSVVAPPQVGFVCRLHCVHRVTLFTFEPEKLDKNTQSQNICVVGIQFCSACKPIEEL